MSRIATRLIRLLAAAVNLHNEAGPLVALMSPALRVATRGGIDKVIEVRQARVDKLAALLEKAAALLEKAAG